MGNTTTSQASATQLFSEKGNRMISDKLISEAAVRAIEETGIGGEIFAVTRVAGKDAEWWVDFTEAERVTVGYDPGDTIETLADKIGSDLTRQREIV